MKHKKYVLNSVLVVLLSSLFLSGSITMAADKKSQKVEVPKAKKLRLLPASKLKKYSDQQLVLYITGVRELLKDLERAQNEKAKKSASNKNESFKEFVEWINFTPKAFADQEERKCIYAAYLNGYQDNGRWCKRPPSEGCTIKGHVQCHPLVFGQGVCVQKHPEATRLCEENGRPMKEVIRNLKENWNEWNKYAADINRFCETGKQEMECGYIQARIAQLNEIVADAGQAISEAPYTTPTDTMTDGGSVRYSLIGDGLSTGAIDIDPNTVTSQCRSHMNRQQVCNPQALFEEVETPFDKDNGSDPVTLMNFQEAYALGCQGQELRDNSITQAKNRLKMSLAQIGRGGDETNEYYRQYLCNLDVNLERCRKRQGQVSGSSASRPYYLKYSGPNATLYTSNNRQVFTTHGQWFGRSLNVHGISLCDVDLWSPMRTRPKRHGSGTVQ